MRKLIAAVLSLATVLLAVSGPVPAHADYDAWGCAGGVSQQLATTFAPPVQICEAELPTGRQTFALGWRYGANGIVTADVTAGGDEIAQVRCRVSLGVPEICRVEGFSMWRAGVLHAGWGAGGWGVLGEIDVPADALVSVKLEMVGMSLPVAALYRRGGEFSVSHYSCLNFCEP